MSEVTDLVVIEKANALTVFKSSDQIEEILAKIEHEVMSFVPDVTTAKGRKEIASLAYRVSQTKSYLDGLGKDLVAELKEIPKLIDVNRKTVRDRLDALRDKARQPFTDWEIEQERIKAEEAMNSLHAEALVMDENIDLQRAAQFEADHEMALLMNDKFDRDREEQRRLAEQAQREHEERIKREAAEQARRDAEAKHKAEIEAAARREAEEKARAEAAERQRIEAEQRAAREKQEAEARAERERAAAVDAERLKAKQAEDARLAEQKRIADEQAKREADVKHRKTVGTNIVNALTNHTSLNREQAIEVLTALKDDLIPCAKIHY